MTEFREESGRDTGLAAPPREEQEPQDFWRDNGQPALPAGWRRLPIRLAGARLYHITPPGGGAAYWQAEMVLNGEVEHRRCVSEIHALWWIAALVDPRAAGVAFDLDERNERLRAHFISHP